MIAHLAGYHHPGYLEFIEEAKPEVVQVGWYGAHFYSLAPTHLLADVNGYFTG